MSCALVLFSGSTASAVAVRLLQRISSLELHLLHVRSPFFGRGDEVRALAERLFPDLPLRCQTLKRDYLNLNCAAGGLPFPCGVCRLVLLKKAARAARRIGAEVIGTGELLDAGGLGPAEMETLDRAAGLAGRVVRPLAGRALAPTLAEKKGWLDPSGLWALDVAHEDLLRSRAAHLGIGGTVPAAERCAMSDPHYAHRLELMARAGPLTVNALQLLRFSNFQHYPPDLKVVVACGRNEQADLQSLFLPFDVRMYLPAPRSPLALIRADWRGWSHDELRRALLLGSVATVRAAGMDGSPCTVLFRFEFENETRRLALPAFRQGAYEEGADLHPASMGVSLPPLMSLSS